MIRKLCTVGNSRGVSIPAEFLKKLALSLGSEVEVKLDEEKGRIVIEPLDKNRFPPGIDWEFVDQVNDFIAKYRPALIELAKK